MAITLLPAIPQRTDTPPNFILKADAFLGALPQFVTDANALAAGLNSIAAGGATSVPYKYITQGSFVAGAGNFALNNATQSSATSFLLDNTSLQLQNISAIISSVTSSASTTKAYVRVTKVGDSTKALVFRVTGYTAQTGYSQLDGVVVFASTANPFSVNDSLSVYIDRVGDIGTAGTIVRRPASTASTATLTPNIATTDISIVTAQAATLTIAAPTGSPADGQGLMFRIKDNGTARSLVFNAIYRASTDLAIPSSTVANKTLYIGYIYNAADTKWDLVSVLNNI